MLRPRWKKVLRDLSADRTRTMMVVLSIAVGVFAFGTIMTTRTLVAENLDSSYLATNPASATITTEPFDEGLVSAVRNLPAVAEAQGTRVVAARVEVAAGVWQDAALHVLPDDGARPIAIVAPWSGDWPPADKTLLVERSTLARSGAAVGEPIRMALPGQAPRELPIIGLAHDLSLSPATAASQVVGYVTLDTLAWLGGPRSYEQLQIVVRDGRGDEAQIAAVVAEVERVVRSSGRRVLATDVPTPLQHPAEAVLPAVLDLLTRLSVLALLISAFLIVNTIGAILAQQTRQIGVMKAIGARAMQLAGLYFALSAAFGLLALVLAVPLGAFAAFGLTRFLGGLLNVDMVQLRLPIETVAMQALTAVLVPLLASVMPVRGVVLRPVRETLAGATDAPSGRSPVEWLLQRVRGLSRPTRLALRNTFRRRGRLIRTLAALALGGAVFISVLTLRASLYTTMDASIATQRYDVEVQLGRPYRAERAIAAVAALPEVTAVEALRRAGAVPIRPDGGEGEALNLRAVPADTAMFAPRIAAGRWLLPADERAVVLTTNYRVKDPGARIGDPIRLKIDGHESDWRIVGFVDELIPPVSPAGAYVPLDAFARIAGALGRADTLRVATLEHSPSAHAAASAAIEGQLAAQGFEVLQVRSRSADRAILDAQFAILIAVLTMMALLIGTVGGLGLSGTMSINVLERTREIGVMRAIGASDGAVRRIILSEGLTVAVLAWLVGAAVSLPLSYGMCIALGLALLNTPLTWVYSPAGVAIWLLIVLAIASLASLLPARSAVRLTVCEVLAYE